MQKYEWVWRIFFLVVLGLATILLKKVYSFQTLPYFEKIRMGNLTEILSFGLPFAFLFSVNIALFRLQIGSFTIILMTSALNTTSHRKDTWKQNQEKKDAIHWSSGDTQSSTT